MQPHQMAQLLNQVEVGRTQAWKMSLQRRQALGALAHLCAGAEGCPLVQREACH